MRRCQAVSLAVVAVAIILARMSDAISISGRIEPARKDLLILGLGRVGLEVARQALVATKTFGRICGTVRRRHGDDVCGIARILLLENNMDEIRKTARSCSHILITIPPSKDEAESIATECTFQSIVEELPVSCWIGILSTTGVYGNHNGTWVSEETACDPASSITASRYLAYEDAWKERAARCSSLRVFRCAGIYGPDQSALHTVFKIGLPRRSTEADASQDVTNRIHVHDLAAAILASMQQHGNDDERNGGDCCHSIYYNLADDLPESRTVVMDFAAQLLQSVGVPIAPEAAPVENIVGSRARRRQSDQKRVSNRKMKRELLVDTLKYPTYKEGLAEILLDRKNPWWRCKT